MVGRVSANPVHLADQTFCFDLATMQNHIIPAHKVIFWSPVTDSFIVNNVCEQWNSFIFLFLSPGTQPQTRHYKDKWPNATPCPHSLGASEVLARRVKKNVVLDRRKQVTGSQRWGVLFCTGPTESAYRVKETNALACLHKLPSVNANIRKRMLSLWYY